MSSPSLSELQHQHQDQWTSTRLRSLSSGTPPKTSHMRRKISNSPQFKPVVVANHDANSPTNQPVVATLSEEIEEASEKEIPFIIGICGGSASGKTTVCREIIDTLSNKRVVTISQDSFYRNLTPEENERAFAADFNFDSPDAFDYEAFEQVVHELKRGNQNIAIPIYDFKTNARVDGESYQLPSADVILIEGILVFYSKSLREAMDMKIFVDTDPDTSLARRIRRDLRERGRDLDSILTQYERFVKPSYDDFITPTKKYADIIIPRGGANRVAIDLIAQHIKTKVKDCCDDGESTSDESAGVSPKEE